MNNNDKDFDANQKKKVVIGQSIAVAVIALYVILGALILNHSAVLLPIMLGGIVLVFAPIVAFFYLREVRRGVFADNDEEEVK